MEKFNIGLDFGTTYSCIGVWKDGGICIIPNSIGERTTPSVVNFVSPNKAYVGEETLNHLSQKNSVKIYEIKRLIGKRYDEIEDILPYLSYTVVKEENGERPLIKITFDNNESVEYYPEQIAFLIIKKLLMNAESFLNTKIYEIIITVPADFNDFQRNALKFVVEYTGVKVKRIINEPCAAALSYGFPKNSLKNALPIINQNYELLKNDVILKISHPMEDIFLDLENINNKDLLKFSLKTSYMDIDDKKILIFDFGGGTYDVSLIEVINNTIFETRASAGNQHLGGRDLDNKLMEECLEYFCKQLKIEKVDVKNNYKCMQRLKIACEKTKKILSVKEEDVIYIEDFYKNETLNIKFSRARFEKICSDYFNKLIPPIDRVLDDASIQSIDINEIVLVGGSSRIPRVNQILKEKFNEAKINDSINPDEAVAFGATIYSESLIRDEGEFWEDFQYLDATQHSYGIEVEDGTIDIVLPRGSKYPTSKEKFYSNAYDDQYTFVIRVYEGENKYNYENQFLAEFTLEDIPKKKKGELILSITFNIDINQILYVTAFVAEGNRIEKIEVKKENNLMNSIYDDSFKLKIGKISLIGNELDKQEKKLKMQILTYSKKFKELTEDKDKFELIKNYNIVMNNYLMFLEENYQDCESEKYLLLVEQLFKSYSYFFKTQLLSYVDINMKFDIENNLKNYLEKIYKRNPFRIKQLLNHFLSIKREKSEIFYSLVIYSMELLQKKADEYFATKERSKLQIAKCFYEECLIIGKVFEEKNIKTLVNNSISAKYDDIKILCERNIKIISADSLLEIENTKNTGKLFSNEKNMDDENLSLLSFNLNQTLKDLNDIDNLNENKEALETKSICLATIVKIEFLKKNKNINIQNMLEKAIESISIVEILEEEFKKKEWYKEIVKLQEELKKMSDLIPAPSIEDIQQLQQEFKTVYQNGKDEFVKHLLAKHPYEGCNIDKDLENYNKNKKFFLIQLQKKYKTRNTIINTETNGVKNKNDVIIEFINNCLNDIGN